jgi:hypothetical protein
MRLGLGSLDKVWPATSRRGDEAALYREVLAEVTNSRIMCLYPPDSTKNWRENALLIANSDPVRWQVYLMNGYWHVRIFVLEHIVAEGWLQRYARGFGRDIDELTPQEQKDFLKTLDPDDTAWEWNFKVSESVFEHFARTVIGGNQALARTNDSQWFSLIISAAIWHDGQPFNQQIYNIDDVPQCPARAVPRPPPKGKLRSGYQATQTSARRRDIERWRRKG